MRFKTIYLRMADGDDTSGSVDFALELARRHGATLFAQFFAEQPDFEECLANAEDARFVEEFVDSHREQMRAAEALFLKRIVDSSVEASWCSYDPNSLGSLIELVRHADLVISGRILTPKQQRHRHADTVVENLALASGRPLLLLPSGGEAAVLPKKIAIAWDRSQAATRAIHDALPLLEQAEDVTVLTVSHDGRPFEHLVPGLDIESALLRHGVHCTRSDLKAEGHAVGRAIMDECVHHGVELIVAGAYGHRRWQELIIGGVTRELLHLSPIPALFSH